MEMPKTHPSKAFNRCVSFLGAGLLLAALVTGAACTPEQYAAQADRTAYNTIRRGQATAMGKVRPFGVDYSPGQYDTSGGETKPASTQPAILTLDKALEIAFTNSRDFQTRKETLYSASLALANASRTWNWSFVDGQVSGGGEWTRSARGGAEGATDATAKTADAQANPSIVQRFIHGGILTLGATLDFATDFLGSDSTPVGSLLEANLTQPLLQGAWRGFAYEDQYRLKRDFIFAVYDYARFRQRFAADIVTDYYSVLSQRDQLENERMNIERLRETLALTRVLVEGGQVSRIQGDQAEQNLLNAQVRFEANKRRYRNQLDSFKITLGLPVTTPLEPDYPAALEALTRAGPQEMPISEDDAVAAALSSRPSLLTARANVRDAAKDVEIAADKFNPQLDVTLAAGVPSTEPQKFWRLQGHKHTRSAVVEFNYEIDQTDNRDDYRNAIIAFGKARRDLAEAEDNIRLNVRQAYRSLLESQRTYQLQKRSVTIALRRRKLASLQQKEGEASARDVLEAEEALRDAQNGLTSALIQYTTTRLEFLADIGMIEVDPKGNIRERNQPFRFDRIREQYSYVELGESETISPGP